MFVITYFNSPGVATVEPASPCGGRCLRCGLPIRSSTQPSSRSSTPAFTDRPPPAGSRSADVTSGARRDSRDNEERRAGGATCVADAGCIATTAKKRVRFASPTDHDVTRDFTHDVTDDVSRQLEPVTPLPPSPPPPPGTSFIKIPPTAGPSLPICRSQLGLLQPSSYGSAATMTTFVGPHRDASIV